MHEGGRSAAETAETAGAADESSKQTRLAGRERPGAEAEDARLAAWLSAAGAPQAMCTRIARALGEGAAELVAADPWSVLEVTGVAPQAADALARVVIEGVRPDDPRRTRALVSWLLRRAAAVGGHTVQGADRIAEALGRFGVSDATGAIADAIEHGAALAFAQPLTLSDDAEEAEIEDFERADAEDDDDPVAMLTSGRTLLAVEAWAFAEQSAAEAAQRLAATPDALESKQQAAAGDALVAAVAEHGLTLVTGAAAPRLAELAQSFPAALLTSACAAGLRTMAQAGADAVDARALAEDPERIGAADVLVVADAQLLGLELGTALLEATRDGAHVVLAGDPATLQASGPGLFFRDLLETEDPGFGGRLPRMELKQRPSGPLSALTDSVRHGGLPPQELLQGPDGTSREVVIVPVRESAEAVHRAVQVAADSIPRAFGLSGADVLVVAPDAEGAAGSAALNAALKARLNPGPGACGGFDPGDRVIVSIPLREQGLFGGETGTVRSVDGDALTIAWDAPHERRAVPGADPSQTTSEAPQAPSADVVPIAQARALHHAWALTVAEAQGGRWPAVVAVFDGQSAPKLTRALTLGAITLATRHLTVVHGAGGTLAQAVERIADHPRHTRLKHALRE